MENRQAEEKIIMEQRYASMLEQVLIAKRLVSKSKPVVWWLRCNRGMTVHMYAIVQKLYR